jgi:hypothetical protein
MALSNAGPVTPERILQFAWGHGPPLVLEAAIAQPACLTGRG